ncbi:hypothetical protein STSP2_00577 [Anaerohalosphaera lusitana]|uniref:Uncharacterized protein n=1 Tax=Anaerohalosphaera lusitana TaxID=1936003 RepID=A0A1U9NIL3_9BACT|nr:hypothetical protein [Anaerohalosphaera lusitana]AQT67430.1 hypothetical protein STSP2_00577 [Anaerohalosphaera lusitana]
MSRFSIMTLSTVIIAIILSASPAHAAMQEEFIMWYDKPADDYGFKSPLRCWEVENPNRTHKPNPDQAWEKYALPLGNGLYAL